MEQHLGTAHELTWFAMNMAEQLEIHQKEKTPLREVDLRDVIDLCLNEIKVRHEKLSDLSALPESQERNDELVKQSIHIANYCMMLFLRTKYNV